MNLRNYLPAAVLYKWVQEKGCTHERWAAGLRRSCLPFLFSSPFRLLTFNALLFYHPFSFLSYFFFFFLLLPSYFLSSFQSINQEKHRQDDRSTSRRQQGVQVSTPSLAILSDQAE